MKQKDKFLLELWIFYLVCVFMFLGTFAFSYYKITNNPDAVVTIKESAIKKPQSVISRRYIKK